MILDYAIDANTDALEPLLKTPMKDWLKRFAKRHNVDSITNFLYAIEYSKQRQLAAKELKKL